MPAIVNVPDFLKIGLMAVLFIWLFNKAMGKLDLPQFKA